eukprot:284815142_1
MQNKSERVELLPTFKPRGLPKTRVISLTIAPVLRPFPSCVFSFAWTRYWQSSLWLYRARGCCHFWSLPPQLIPRSTRRSSRMAQATWQILSSESSLFCVFIVLLESQLGAARRPEGEFCLCSVVRKTAKEWTSYSWLEYIMYVEAGVENRIAFIKDSLCPCGTKWCNQLFEQRHCLFEKTLSLLDTAATASSGELLYDSSHHCVLRFGAFSCFSLPQFAVPVSPLPPSASTIIARKICSEASPSSNGRYVKLFVQYIVQLLALLWATTSSASTFLKQDWRQCFL